jgi:hypothetical protein
VVQQASFYIFSSLVVTRLGQTCCIFTETKVIFNRKMVVLHCIVCYTCIIAETQRDVFYQDFANKVMQRGEEFVNCLEVAGFSRTLLY